MRIPVWGILVAALGLMLMLWGALAFPVWAETSDGTRWVYDQAGLFEESEISEYQETMDQLRDTLGFDLVLVTTQDAEGKTGQEYADDFYDAGGFGQGSEYDGILFLIDMDHRELVFSTSGRAERIFTDAQIADMLDHVYEGASEGDFSASAEAFLQDAAYYGEKGISANQYTYDEDTGKVSVYRSIRWYEALLALLVSGGVAAGACLQVKKEYAMEADSNQIRNLNMAYRADCQFAFHNETDQLVNQFVTSRIIPRSTGGTGGRSGGSGAGRSTVHRSSSGRSHGGGSRRF